MCVFISSTVADLVDEHQAVYRRLSETHDVVRMEDVGSRDEESIETCLEAVESCDVYVLLVGARYGTVEVTYNLSYTHGRERRS